MASLPVNNPPQFKKSSRRRPRWLGLLLEKSFFKICDQHPNQRKNEVNIYCIDCDRCVCSHCLEPTASGHATHELLQIRRYVFQDVIRIRDMQKLVDCSDVQPYTVNSAKVVLLRPREQSKPSKSSTSACEICGHAIAHPNRYCSMACKVSERVPDEPVLSGSEDVGTAGATQSPPLTPSPDSDLKKGEDLPACQPSQPSDSKEASPKKKMHRRKRTIPRRAPFF